jgi:hypothetical protein
MFHHPDLRTGRQHPAAPKLVSSFLNRTEVITGDPAPTSLRLRPIYIEPTADTLIGESRILCAHDPADMLTCPRSDPDFQIPLLDQRPQPPSLDEPAVVVQARCNFRESCNAP